jgi:hypothetical protein
MFTLAHINDTVRLTRDIPNLWLERGCEGVVRSIWFSPTTVYEVEFDGVGLDCRTRALLLDDQIEQIELKPETAHVD